MSDGLTTDKRDRIIAMFEKFPEIEDVILYGSRAKGTHKASSDIDITLKGENIDLGVMSKVVLLADDLMLPYKFDISIYHQIANPELLEHINRVGKSLYTCATDA